MTFTEILTLIGFIFLIVSKLLDVLSTLARIHHSSQETNPFARKMMVRFGTHVVIWAIFVLALLIIALAGVLAFSMGIVFQIIFILFGTIVSIIQFSVAMNNWTGRENGITKIVRYLYSRIGHRVIR